MTKTALKRELKKKLDKMNTKIDKLIIEGKAYKHLTDEHNKLVMIMEAVDNEKEYVIM